MTYYFVMVCKLVFFVISVGCCGRTRRHTGKARRMQSDCRESMESHFLTQNSRKNGRKYKKKLQNVITEKSAGFDWQHFDRLVVTIGSVCVWLYSCFITCDLVLYKQLFDDTDYRQCVLTLTGSGIVLLSWVESWQLLLSAKRCTHLQHPLWSNTGNCFVSCFFWLFLHFLW